MRALLEASFICVADDADNMTPALRALGVTHLANARMLPFLLVTDAEGNWLAGASGGTTPGAFMRLLQSALPAA